jgi:hypothetical protein
MKTIDEIRIRRTEDIKAEAVASILRTLGFARAAVFFREHLSGQTNYLDFKQRAFGTETVASLTARMQAQRLGESEHGG